MMEAHNFIGVPIGTIIAFYGNNIPGTYLLCDGREINEKDYPTLHKLLPMDKKIPDLRGQFLRGLDPGGKIDTEKRTIGSNQEDALQNITGNITHIAETFDHYGTATGVFEKESGYRSNDRTPQHHDGNNTGKISFDASRVTRTASETRPKNIAVNFIIRASVR